MVNGLSQTLLKIAAPGVPDFYRDRNYGTCAWSIPITRLGPVDSPQKSPIPLRRIVDPDTTDQQLSELRNHWHDGRIKPLPHLESDPL